MSNAAFEKILPVIVEQKPPEGPGISVMIPKKRRQDVLEDLILTLQDYL